MRSAPRSPSVLVGLALLACPAVAKPDVGPEEEILYGQHTISATVTVTGAARFPDHVFYVFPAFCTTDLAALDEQYLEFYEQDEYKDRPNYLELVDGPLLSWISSADGCPDSKIYALARDIAAEVDLAAMPLAKLREFFEGDQRLFHSDFQFMPTPLYASKHSPLTSVSEVLRILRVTDEGVAVVLESSTYRFADGTEQTLKLAHTRRPPPPFKPLKPEKVAKYEATYARWEARQPAEPPPAPRLPAYADTDAGTTGGTGTTGLPASEAPLLTDAVPAAEPPIPAPTAGAAAAARNDAPPPAAPAPVEAVPPAAAPVNDPEDMNDETEAQPDRTWLVGAGLAAGVALLAGLALARRRPAGS